MGGRTTAVFILCILAAGQAAAQSASLDLGFTTPEGTSARSPHPPIRITSDLGLLLPDSVSGNGVVGGRGLPEDPFVIAGWEIPFTWTTPAILLQGTRMHVILRDLVLLPEKRPHPSDFAIGPAVLTEGVTNLTIESVRIEDDWDGTTNFVNSDVRVRHAVLANSTLRASGGRLTMEEIEIHGTTRQSTGVMCFGCTLEVKRLRLWGYGDVPRDETQPKRPGGIYLSEGRGSLEDVTGTNLGNGSMVVASGSTLLWRNGWIDSSRAGSVLAAQEGSSVQAYNVHARGGGGMLFDESRVELHDFVTEGGAVFVRGGEAFIEGGVRNHGAVFAGASTAGGPSKVVIRNVSFLNASHHVVVGETGTPVDARWNWWGSSEGPLVGKESKGGRAGIRGNVQYEPWLMEGPVVARREPPIDPAWGLLLAALAVVVPVALWWRGRR